MAFRRNEERDTSADLEVIVVRQGGTPVRVNLEDGASVQDAIDNADFTVKSGDTVSVNGDEVDRDELDELVLEDGDRVQLTANFEGGSN